MQIHELTHSKKSKLNEVDWVGPDSVFNQAKSAWKTGGRSLWSTKADQEATQARYQDYAAKEIAKGQELGYLTVPTLADSLAKLKSNPVAQQWLNGVVAKWPEVAKSMSANGKLEEGPEYTTPGGIVIPSGVKTATSSATSSGYDGKFRQWVDSQLRTTNLAQLEASDSEVKKQLENILKKIVDSQNNPPAQQKLVHDFFSIAIAANHILQAKQRITGKYGLANAPKQKPEITKQTLASVGLTPMQLRTLGQAAVKAGATNPTSTGNKFWDTLIHQTLASIK